MKEFLENKNLWPLNDIFKSLVERSKISITYYSPINGKILLINKTAARAVHSTPENLDNKTIYEIFPQFADQIKERTDDIISNQKEIITKDFIKPTPDSGFWFESSYAPIFTGKNNLYAIQITSNDISSRIETEKDMEIMQQNLFDQYMREKNLKELLHIQASNLPLKEKLDSAINLILNAQWMSEVLKGYIFISDSENITNISTYIKDGIDPKNVIACCSSIKIGDGLCGKTALDGTEFLASKKECYCSEPLLDEAYNNVRYVLPIKYEENIEGTFTFLITGENPLKDVELLFVRSACSIMGIMIRSEKNNIQIEQHRTNLINSSKLASLGEMASGVAHEINNPLTIINGYSKILLNAANRQDDNIQELMLQFLPQIDLTVERISRIVQGLQNFSRDGSQDKMEIKPIGDLLNKTLTFCHKKFMHHNIPIDIIIKPENIKVSCSETQLSQVFLNLLNNSFGAIKDFEEKWINIKCFIENDKIIIQFIDSGKGISKKIQEKLMEPFFTTKDPKDGTGLGLSISTTIIKNHNGVLNYKPDQPNTTFEIILPAQK